MHPNKAVLEPEAYTVGENPSTILLHKAADNIVKTTPNSSVFPKTARKEITIEHKIEKKIRHSSNNCHELYMPNSESLSLCINPSQ